MKAALLFEVRRLFETESGKTIVMVMDLYELPEASAADDVHTRYKFSWIAFRQEAPEERVLFDCHKPKGIHYHIDDDKEGQPLECSSISETIELFQSRVAERFGELIELPNDGGYES